MHTNPYRPPEVAEAQALLAARVFGQRAATAPVASNGALPTTFVIGDLLYADSTSTLARLADVATGRVLRSGGVGVAPAWGQVALTTDVTGTLPAANGGTGQNTYTVGDLLYASGATALSKLADVAAGSYLRAGGVGNAPLWSTTTLPNSATTGDLLYVSAANTYSNLADVATGNVLRAGGVGVAPAWGKVALTTDISGNLPVTNLNGGTSATSATVWRGDATWSAAVVGPWTADRFIPAGSTVPTNGMYLPAANTVGIATNSIERLRIGSAGLLTSTGGLLVTNAVSQAVRFDNDSGFIAAYDSAGSLRSGYFQINAASGGLLIASEAANYISLITNSIDRMRVDVSGNVLIGASTTAGNAGIQFLPSAGACVQSINHVTGTASGTGFTFFNYNGSSIGSITQTGTVAVLYNTTSDERLKNNISDAPEAGGIIDSIRVRSHGWKFTPGENVTYGFIAQELVNIAPQAVSIGDSGDSVDRVWGVDNSKLVPLIIRELQSIRSRLSILETH